MPAKANIDPCSDPVVEEISKEFVRAEKHGYAAIRHAFHLDFNVFKFHTEFFAPLALAMLRLSLSHWANGREHVASTYNDFFLRCKDYALSNLEGDELAYFLRQIE